MTNVWGLATEEAAVPDPTEAIQEAAQINL